MKSQVERVKYQRSLSARHSQVVSPQGYNPHDA
jgi:hypothetical protein